MLQNLMNGLDGWALALSLVGLVVGAAAWALGSHGQNYQQSYVGAGPCSSRVSPPC